MRLIRKPTYSYGVRWTGEMTASELRAELPGVDAMVQNDRSLRLLAGKGGAQGWVPVPVGHWLLTDGSGDDYWPCDDTYIRENFIVPEDS